MRSRILGLIAIVGLVAACSAASAGPASYAAQRATVRNDDGVQLELSVDRSTFQEGEPIAVATTLTYLGSRDALEVDGSGRDLVVHSVREVIGERDYEASFNLDCDSHELRRGEPMDIPLQMKGSSITPEPDEAFEAGLFFADQPTLPRGTWMIDAVARYYPVADCGGPERLLTASVVVDVR